MTYQVGSTALFRFNGTIMTGEIAKIYEDINAFEFHINGYTYCVPGYNIIGPATLVASKQETVVDPPQEIEPEKTPEEVERERLRKFFFGDSSELSSFAKQRKAEGKCPVCGEDGRIHLSTFVCSKHGTY